MVLDLIKHGVVENKTLTSVYPKQEKFFIDFLRGYIDGDGCIYINHYQNDYVTVHITAANTSVLKYVGDTLREKYMINSGIYTQKDRKHRIMITGQNALRLLNILYYDDTVEKLDRKYQKYLQVRLSHPEMVG